MLRSMPRNHGHLAKLEKACVSEESKKFIKALRVTWSSRQRGRNALYVIPLDRRGRRAYVLELLPPGTRVLTNDDEKNMLCCAVASHIPAGEAGRIIKLRHGLSKWCWKCFRRHLILECRSPVEGGFASWRITICTRGAPTVTEVAGSRILFDSCDFMERGIRAREQDPDKFTQGKSLR
jgi:hypothetical protein